MLTAVPAAPPQRVFAVGRKRAIPVAAVTPAPPRATSGARAAPATIPATGAPNRAAIPPRV